VRSTSGWRALEAFPVALRLRRWKLASNGKPFTATRISYRKKRTNSSVRSAFGGKSSRLTNALLATIVLSILPPSSTALIGDKFHPRTLKRLATCAVGYR